MTMARHTADSYDRIAELTQQYSAEALPEDVRDIIPDFFLESYDKSERVENFGRYDYVTDSLTDEEYTIGSSLETEGNGEGERDEAEGVPLLRNVLNNLDDIPVDLKSSGQVFDEYFREGCGCLDADVWA
ncbi:unnamed protein product [Medioppia subpectinata]|uniref:Uncharacterized protein n=1 Tax=Medioppia subpectinata TaxID=1979941 RepID=A0A7R9Q053_9ACAR|nr:unnamed protein product [Medioppia subpectinata]CAG2107749.1 unnamed protein product [Medioppia subpectinata]